MCVRVRVHALRMLSSPLIWEELVKTELGASLTSVSSPPDTVPNIGQGSGPLNALGSPTQALHVDPVPFKVAETGDEVSE